MLEYFEVFLKMLEYFKVFSFIKYLKFKSKKQIPNEDSINLIREFGLDKNMGGGAQDKFCRKVFFIVVTPPKQENRYMTQKWWLLNHDYL